VLNIWDLRGFAPGGTSHLGFQLEHWVSKTKKHYFWFRSDEFILRNEGLDARGKGLLAFSLKSAAGGRSPNLYQGNTYPRTHYSSIPCCYSIILILQRTALMDNLVP